MIFLTFEEVCALAQEFTGADPKERTRKMAVVYARALVIRTCRKILEPKMSLKSLGAALGLDFSTIAGASRSNTVAAERWNEWCALVEAAARRRSFLMLQRQMEGVPPPQVFIARGDEIGPITGPIRTVMPNGHGGETRATLRLVGGGKSPSDLPPPPDVLEICACGHPRARHKWWPEARDTGCMNDDCSCSCYREVNQCPERS